MKKTWMMAVGMAMAAGLAWGQETATEIALPGQVPGLIDWFLASKAVSIVKYAAVITMVVQILKTAVVLFGGKVPAKLMPGIVALMGLLGLWESVTADGQIDGGDWSALIVAVLGTLAAFFGYKVLFSAKSAVQGE